MATTSLMTFQRLLRGEILMILRRDLQERIAFQTQCGQEFMHNSYQVSLLSIESEPSLALSLLTSCRESL